MLVHRLYAIASYPSSPVCFLLLLILCTGNFITAQPFHNASYYVGDEAEDELLSGDKCLVESQELLLFSLNQQTNVLDMNIKSLDYLPIAENAEASVRAGSFGELPGGEPLNSNTSGQEDRQSYPLVIDYNGDGTAEIFRVEQGENCALSIYHYAPVFDLQDNNSLGQIAPTLVKYVNREAGACDYATLNIWASAKLTVMQGKDFDDHRLVVSYLDQASDNFYQLNIEIYSLDANYQVTAEETLSFTTSSTIYDIASADLVLDGKEELIIAYKNDTTTLVEILQASETGYAVAATTHFDTRPEFGVISLEVGDFDGDIAPEIVLGVGYLLPIPLLFYPKALVDLYVLQNVDNRMSADTNLLDTIVTLSTTTVAESLVTQAVLGGYDWPMLDLSSGDITGNGTDELVVGLMITDGIISFLQDVEVLAWNTSTAFEELADEPPAEGLLNLGITPVPRSFVQVVDLDGDNRAEIAYSFTTLSDESTDFYSQEVRVYTYDDVGSFRHTGTHSSTTPRPENVQSSYFYLMIGDLDNDEIRLGTPRYFKKTNLQQPLVILNAPPIHFDQLNGSNIDINGCYNGQDCDFRAVYTEESTMDVTAKTEVSSDWAVSASLSGSISGPAGKVKAKVRSKYGESFGSYRGTGSSINISSEITASVEDRIYATVADYGIYEYPIYEGDSLIGHIMTITPEISQNRWFSTNSWQAYDYFPRHEVGNLLSYQSYASLQDDATLASLIKAGNGNGDAYGIDGSSNYLFSVDYGSVETVGGSHSTNFEISASASATVGKKLFGLGATVTATVTGRYAREEVSTYETTVEETMGLSVYLGNSSAGLESNYNVTPYYYWSNNGALILDYSVDPDVEPPGGTPGLTHHI